MENKDPELIKLGTTLLKKGQKLWEYDPTIQGLTKSVNEVILVESSREGKKVRYSVNTKKHCIYFPALNFTNALKKSYEMQTEKLVSLPLRKWMQIRNEGFDIPMTDFKEELFLKSVFRRKHPADLIQLMADKTMLVTLVSLFKIFLNKDEIESAMVQLADSTSKFLIKVKTLLLLSHPDYKGPINLSIDLDQIDLILNNCIQEPVEQINQVLSTPVKAKTTKSVKVSK